MGNAFVTSMVRKESRQDIDRHKVSPLMKDKTCEVTSKFQLVQTMVGPAHVGACLGPDGQVFVALTPHEQKQCLAL